MKIRHRVCFKRNCAIKHCKKNNSYTPNISLETIVALVSQNLRSNICRSSTLLNHFLFSRLDYSWHAKICNFNISMTIKQNVIKFNISMNYIHWVNMLNSFNDLFEDELCNIFLQFTSFSNIVQKISTGTNFHNKHNMFLHFKSFKKLHDIWMSKHLQYLSLK